MDVILLADQRHLGQRGQIVDVKPGYARNYLFPQQLALAATEGNVKYFQEQKKKIDARHTRERDAAAEIAGELASIRLVVKKRVGETETLYGSVTATEIGDMLAEKGVQVDRRRIDLDGGIKTLGDHKINIDLHPEVVAEIIVSVEPAE